MTLPVIKYFSTGEPDDPRGGSSTAGLNSIVSSVDDLRQHLGNLAATQIEDAESTVQTLLSRLAELNSRLATLAAIQRSMTVAYLALENCQGSGNDPSIDTILRSADPPEGPRTTNLVQFPRSVKLHLSSAKSLEQCETPPSFATSRPDTAPPPENMPCSPPSHDDRCERLDSSEPAPVQPFAIDAPKDSSNIDFDQRLLDDLIRNYGEFVTLSKSEPRIDAELRTLDLVVCTQQSSPAEAHTPQHPQRNHDLPAKEKDIDRQLKKIIQDYGEYDLYSVPASMAVKYATLGAIVLALVGLLLYFAITTRYSVSFSHEPLTAWGSAFHTRRQVSAVNTRLREIPHTALISIYQSFDLHARATHPHSTTA